MNIEYSTARTYYLREYPEGEAHFGNIWHTPEGKKLIEEIVAKYGVIDIMGNKIEVGDIIAYSITEDRSALLYLYKVLEVRENGKLKAQAVYMPSRWHIPDRASSLTYPESRAMVVQRSSQITVN